jgi:cytidylate kinase
MHDSPVDLITISREFGSGGSELGQALGARLGWPVLDHDLVHRVAERLHLGDEVVKAFDERPPQMMARLATALLFGTPDCPIPSEPTGMPDADTIAAATRRAIMDASRDPPVIIVGHGGQALLRGRPGTLHLRLVAPLESRVRRIVARSGIDPRRAADDARRMDECRRAYVRRHHQCDLRDVQLYDLVINTGSVSIEEASELVATIVERRGAPAHTAARA